MISYDLFHPNHVIPSTKFISAFMEGPNLGESKMLMKLLTVSGQVFILYYRITDTGIQVQNVHVLKSLFKSFIQSTPITTAF